ncbi:hypothetical protein DL771_005033 [Monosporascus sp. 5C6A]|nr:hypothetical protein DL771_005033 [Monosporascus sp. 5C6A]
MQKANKHFDFGGTGLIGPGVVNELLSSYLEHGVQRASSGVPELQICSGIDPLDGSDEDFAATLTKRVPGVEGITQIFYLVFSSFSNDFEHERVLNCGIIRRMIGAVNIICPSLESFVHSGGTQGYGIYVPNGTFKGPLEEHMTSQLPDDHAKTVSYPCPIGSGYSLALHWAQYLSLYAFNHGIRDSKAEKTVEIPFPGTKAGFDARFTPVSTRILGRISIFPSPDPKKVGGEVINTLNDLNPSAPRELWPEIAGWFGLVGVGPSENGSSLAPSDYVSKHKHISRKMETAQRQEAPIYQFRRRPVAGQFVDGSIQGVHACRYHHLSETGCRITEKRRDPDWEPPSFKIKKGKKDITDKGPQPKSRKARFHDPTEPFGKKSLVYQLKNGPAREKLARLAAGKRSNTNGVISKDAFDRSFEESDGLAGGSKERPSSSDRSKNKPRAKDDGRFSKGERQLRQDGDGRQDRFNDRRGPRNGDGYAKDGRLLRQDRDGWQDRNQTAGTGRQWTQGSVGWRGRSGNTDTGRSRREDSPERLTGRWGEANRSDDRHTSHRDLAKDDSTIRIHHTTAASQFLYGRSVVEAALKNSRRRLYRLYIYNGEDRQNLSLDAGLEKLAGRKGVDITKVGRDGIRMMDKMSGGRPHNGCVLEASPLPQLPLKALGPLSEDTTKPGFSVELAHQSTEEAEVNGTSDFIGYQLPRERKPFILLLDGILDPGNLGAILRSAAFLGVNAVAITKHSSATLTPVALKASAGASEVMTLLSVSSTVDFLTRSKESEWIVYAAVPSTSSRSRGNSHLTLDRVESYDPLATRPTVLVVGSEGEGLTKQVRREADFEVSIPSSSGLVSVVDSLNVSVATGILCSAFLKKQWAGLEIEESTPKEGDDSALW